MSLFLNQDEERPRAGWRIVLQGLLAVILVLFPTAILFLALGVNPETFEQEYLLQQAIYLSVLVSGLFVLISVFLAVRYIDKRETTDIGISFESQSGMDLLVGLLIGLFLVSLVFAVHYTTGFIEVRDTFFLEPELDSGLGFIGASIVAFLVMLMIGVYEEVLARGYQLKNLCEGFMDWWVFNEKTGFIMAAVISSVIFSVLHGANPGVHPVALVNILILGLFLALSVYLTGNISFAVGYHISWNFAMGYIYGYPVSGLNMGVALIRVETERTGIYTGGGFGPEASVLVTAASILGIAALLLYIRVSRGEIGIDYGFGEPRLKR